MCVERTSPRDTEITRADRSIQWAYYMVCCGMLHGILTCDVPLWHGEAASCKKQRARLAQSALHELPVSVLTQGL
jgi:hypothetical protein